MSSKPIRIPGPHHPITIEPTPGRVIVRKDGLVIADSRAALRLHEANYPPVHYIPRADARMDLLRPSDHQSYCPYKGDASYLSAEGLPDSVWIYEHPYAAVAAIAGHLAFYPDRYEIVVQ